MPEPNWRSNDARVTPSDSCPDLVESAAGANVLYSCTVSILMVQLYKYNTFDMYRNRHYTTPWSTVYRLSMNFWYLKMFLARYEFRNILEVRSVSKCTACTQMYFSNLMDADRLYNNFVGQEMNVQPTSENSELAGKYTWLCTIYYVRAEHFAFCRYGRTKSQIAIWITVLDSRGWSR